MHSATSPTAPAVIARDLVKTFGQIRAVDGVSFELAPGRIYGLLGPNGSGKTTLIRLLTGLAHATSGSADILGSRMPSREALGQIGYMTQSDGVYPALSAIENARFFAAAYGIRGRDAAMEALALEHALGRSAPPALARLRARPSTARALPRRADRRHRSVAPGPVLGAFPSPRRSRHDDRRLQPRHGRGGPVRRAPVHAGRTGDRAGHGR
jgi:hypothetical protein